MAKKSILSKKYSVYRLTGQSFIEFVSENHDCLGGEIKTETLGFIKSFESEKDAENYLNENESELYGNFIILPEYIIK